MKTTIEIPDHLLRQIKTLSAEHGFSLRQFVTQALLDRVNWMKKQKTEKPWMKAFGALKHLHQENKKIAKEIEEEFSRIDPKEWS